MSYDAAAFAAEFGLTAEQRGAAERYAALLLEVQAHTNLIGPATVPDLWRRHFADSAQLLTLGGPGGIWVDLGSGAGFPGLVLALLGAEVVLIEARRKKADFLQRVVDTLGLSGRARVVCERAEVAAPVRADVITARAVAPVAQLFDWGLRFAAQETRWVLPKGARVEAELDEARQEFRFECALAPSRTSPEGRIVLASGVERRFHVEPGPKRRG